MRNLHQYLGLEGNLHSNGEIIPGSVQHYDYPVGEDKKPFPGFAFYANDGRVIAISGRGSGHRVERVGRGLSEGANLRLVGNIVLLTSPTSD